MTDTTPANESTVTYRARPLPFIVLGLVILTVAIIIVIRWVSLVEPRKPHSVTEDIPLVTLQSVMLSDNQTTFTSGGFVSAKTTANLSAESSGSVISMTSLFAVGNRVNKGDTLAMIDDKNYVAAVASATANLATAKSNYAQEQAQARQAARDAKRLKVKATDLLLRKPQLSAAKANIANAEAQLKLAKQNLSKTTIKVPFDALITDRKISVGDNVSANTVVAQLVGVETFVVKLTLDSNQFNLVSIGDRVVLTNPSTGTSYSAIINRFDPTLNATTRTVGAYVEIEQPLSAEKPLLLNSYLTAEITGKTLANTMWINNSDSIENQFVWVKNADNTLAKVNFTLLYRGENKSLVQFNQPISHFISSPKDSFFVGEKVTTERPKPRAKGKGKKPTEQGGKRETE